MPQISFTGAFNASTLNVPDVYINVLASQGGNIQPATVDALGIVGIASWGPVNVPVQSSAPGKLALFGSPVVRKWDLVTAATVALQLQQGAGNGTLTLSRVTDGTDTAAAAEIGLQASAATVGAGGTGYAVNDTVTLPGGTILKVLTVTGGAVTTVSIQTQGSYSSIPTNPIAQQTTSGSGTGVTFNLTFSEAVTLTSIHTGSAGNSATYALAAGSSSTTSVPSWKISFQMPGFQTETFDNIPGTGSTFWTNLVNAVNNGNSVLRGPSQLIIATLGSASTTPAATSGTLSGGTDGTATITSSVLVGVDTPPNRTGVYAFRGSGISDLNVADLDDVTQWPTLDTFAQSEGILVHVNGPAGQAVSTAVTAKQTAGVNDVWIKPYLGDWVYWEDNVNGQLRLLGPATFGSAEMSTLQIQQSGLNKQITNVVATQRSKSGIPYGNDEIASLVQGGIEVICNPVPAGNVFGMRIGQTASSDATRNTDNWPRLTSFLARSLAGPGALGPFIGQEITIDFLKNAYAVLDGFFAGLWNSGTIGNSAGTKPYYIQLDGTNNPVSQTATGLVIAKVLVQYLGIARIFLVDLQTGATTVLPTTSGS